MSILLERRGTETLCKCVSYDAKGFQLLELIIKLYNTEQAELSRNDENKTE